MPDQTNFKLYPRGFFGAVPRQHMVSKQVLTENNFGFRSKFIHQIAAVDALNEPNPDVESLYERYIATPIRSGDFEFRKAVLQQALSAFGTIRFDEWMIAQIASPLTGDTHMRFLADTCRFISTGKREVSLENWQRLLEPAESTAVKELPADVKEFLGMHAGLANYNTSLADVIAAWCSQPNGFEDLLGSLFVLFGDSNI